MCTKNIHNYVAIFAYSDICYHVGEADNKMNVAEGVKYCNELGGVMAWPADPEQVKQIMELAKEGNQVESGGNLMWTGQV